MGYPPTFKQRAKELHAQGWSFGKIAKELGINGKATIFRWVNEPDEPEERRNETGNGERGETEQNDPPRRKGEHGKSKSKAKEQIDEAMVRTIRELEDLSQDKPVDMTHPAVTSPDQVVARLEILAWDIATALRAVIPYGDVKQLSGALKITIEMARLIQGKATQIQETRIASTESDMRRSQLLDRMRGLRGEIGERAGAAGIVGIVDGAAGDARGAG